MHLDIAKVQANLDLYHVKVNQDWAKQYFVVTDVVDGIPYVSPLPPMSSLPHQPILPAQNQQFVIVTLRALRQPIGLMLQVLLGPGSSVHLAGPSTSEVRASEGICTMMSQPPLHPSATLSMHTPGPFRPSIAPSSAFTNMSANSSTSVGEDFARTTVQAEEDKNLKKNALKFATYLNLLGGRPGFEAFHRVSLASQAFTLPQITASFENIANASELYFTFRLSTAFTAKLSVFIQGLAGSPNLFTLEHDKKLFVSDFWDTTMIRASAPRTTLDCTSLVQALRAFTTVLDLLLADHPEVLFHVSYVDMFAPVLLFMSNCMNGLEPKALAHFVEVLFFNVFQNGFYALAPDTGLAETKQKVQAVVSTTMAATRRPDFAVTYMQNMAHAQGVEARARNRVNIGAERLATGPSVIDLSTSPPRHQAPGRRRQEERPDAPSKDRPSVPRRQEAQARCGKQTPLPGQLRRVPQSTRCVTVTRGTAYAYQHCSNIRVFIGTFGKPFLTTHIAGLPDSFRQGGGGVELTRTGYQAEWAKQG